MRDNTEMLPATIRTLVLATLPVACFAQLVPATFQVPRTYVTKTYKLVPLGPGLEKQDYDAYMSSIDHLRSTFSGGGWPHAGLTMEEALKDVQGEKARFDARKSFTYAVLTPDGSKELGCLYIKPSPKQGYDATATIWVTKAMYDAGFEATLVKDMKQWLRAAWPFEKIAWPKREIPAEEWKKLPDKPKS